MDFGQIDSIGSTSSRIRPTLSYFIYSTSYMHTEQKAVINIKNKDEKCFLWSVIAGLYGHVQKPKTKSAKNCMNGKYLLRAI